MFAIHGSQDCPTTDNLTSCLDIVHYTNYVNYVGKLTEFDNIEIQPIIFEANKTTKVAVYFLGHIKEVKLSSLLALGKVKFKPVEDHYFKILCINQKREKEVGCFK